MSAKLYTPDILGLAVEVADHPLSAARPYRAEVRSRLCGAALALDAALDDRGAVSELGLGISACAIGQAAAALFARGAVGQTPDQLAAAKDEIHAWLAGGRAAPRWPGLTALEPARAHPGRHGAIRLPWDAAGAALCKATAGR